MPLTSAGIQTKLNSRLLIFSGAVSADALLVGEGKDCTVAEAKEHVCLLASQERGQVAHVEVEEAGSLAPFKVSTHVGQEVRWVGKGRREVG